MTDSFARGDGLGAWVHFMKAYSGGASAEQLHGLLFWKAKDTTLKHSTTRSVQTVKDLAILPYVTRRQGTDLSVALEKFLLATF